MSEMDEDETAPDISLNGGEGGRRCYQRCCCCCYSSRKGPGKRGIRCAVRFSRCFLILPNLFFLLAGFGLTGLGLWIRMDREAIFHLELLRNLPTAGPLISLDRFPVVVISVGCSVAILSFLGCCGSCAENMCCLSMYTFCLIVVFTADVILVIVGFVMRHQIVLALSSSMQQQIITNYNSSSDLSADNRTFSYHFTNAWDAIQIQFDCCGLMGPEDYQSSAWHNRTKMTEKDAVVPASCCYLETRQSAHLPAAKRMRQCQRDAFLYIIDRFSPDAPPQPPPSSEGKTFFVKAQGCQDFIFHLSQQNLSIIASVICATVVLQMADFFFACILLRYVRRKQEEIWYEGEVCNT